MFNFECLDILSSWIGLPCEKLWPIEFVESFIVQFRASRYTNSLSRTSQSKVVAIGICLALWCLISSVSIYYAMKSDIRMKCYDHSNFLRAFVVQFRASRWVMSPNWTSAWKVMTIRFSREHPLFNFVRLEILCAWIWPPCEKLWPFGFLESFRCSISSV